MKHSREKIAFGGTFSTAKNNLKIAFKSKGGSAYALSKASLSGAEATGG